MFLDERVDVSGLRMLWQYVMNVHKKAQAINGHL